MADHSPCVKIDYINDNLLYEYFFQLSVADIAVFNCLETISTMLSGAADKYENVKKINTLVKQNSNITKYLDSRVKTPFWNDGI